MSDVLSAPPPRRAFPWLRYLLGFILIGIIAVAPIIVAVTSSDYAAAQGCQVDEGSIHPCVIGGHDYGETFYALGVAGWLILISAPFGMLASLVLFIAMIVHRVAWGRDRRRAA